MNMRVYGLVTERPSYLDGRGLKLWTKRKRNLLIHERPSYLDGRGLKRFPYTSQDAEVDERPFYLDGRELKQNQILCYKNIY